MRHHQGTQWPLGCVLPRKMPWVLLALNCYCAYFNSRSDLQPAQTLQSILILGPSPQATPGMELGEHRGGALTSSFCLQPGGHSCVNHDLDPGLECRWKADSPALKSGLSSSRFSSAWHCVAPLLSWQTLQSRGLWNGG